MHKKFITQVATSNYILDLYMVLVIKLKKSLNHNTGIIVVHRCINNTNTHKPPGSINNKQCSDNKLINVW